MVSTRAQKYKFSDGEKVLCYEPDPTKAKVLYDSKVIKVLEVADGKDKRGRRVIEYLIHFQGWNSSWDRKVGEDFILKDTEENRQLQKDLAEKSQLHQGTYLYRKERKKQRDKTLTARIETLTQQIGPQNKPPSSVQPLSEEGSSCSNGFGREEVDFSIDPPLDLDTEYYSSSVESNHEEDKVYLQVGDKLKRILEYDYHMVSDGRLVEIPTQLPIVTILEHFVRHYTIRQLFGGQEQAKLRRRNSSFLKGDQKTKDYETIRTNVELCKEVADGLRLYFDFTLKDYLLYPLERQQAELVLSEEYLMNFTYVASPALSLDLLTIRLESPANDSGNDHADPTVSGSSLAAAAQEEKRRRRLRSHKNEENEFVLDMGYLKSDTHSPGIPQALAYSLLKSVFPANVTISYQAKEILEDVFGWKILPSDAPAEPSMIYGATHLARLIVKLPEFLSASSMADEKLKLLLKFLDCFSDYIEEHEEWFGSHVYSEKKANLLDCKLEDSVGLSSMVGGIRIKEEDLDLHDDGIMAGPLLSDVKVEATSLLP